MARPPRREDEGLFLWRLGVFDVPVIGIVADQDQKKFMGPFRSSRTLR